MRTVSELRKFARKYDLEIEGRRDEERVLHYEVYADLGLRPWITAGVKLARFLVCEEVRKGRPKAGAEIRCVAVWARPAVVTKVWFLATQYCQNKDRIDEVLNAYDWLAATIDRISADAGCTIERIRDDIDVRIHRD